jgi:hypothetical protein
MHPIMSVRATQDLLGGESLDDIAKDHVTFLIFGSVHAHQLLQADLKVTKSGVITQNPGQ